MLCQHMFVSRNPGVRHQFDGFEQNDRLVQQRCWRTYLTATHTPFYCGHSFCHPPLQRVKETKQTLKEWLTFVSRICRMQTINHSKDFLHLTNIHPYAGSKSFIASWLWGESHDSCQEHVHHINHKISHCLA